MRTYPFGNQGWMMRKPTGAREGGMMTRNMSVAMCGLLLATGCATPSRHVEDVDYYVPKVYVTGSNIPVRDYGATRIDVVTPDSLNPANRPNCYIEGARPGC
jgi:hypothetical protein